MAESKNNLDMDRVPRHIAIIMDGNGRWATERHQPRSYGHQVGVEHLTLYTFSTENWNRPADEVSALMGLVLTALEDEIFMKHNVRFRVIGDTGRLPDDVRRKLRDTEAHTAGNTAMTMVVALSYSARWEMTQAVRDIIGEHGTRLQPANITEELLARHMQTSFMPDPDLLIRTGGELRVSNFLLWQIAYSELYFCDTYWPDFDEDDLHDAIRSYQSRQRRFGKTEEQMEKEHEQTDARTPDAAIQIRKLL